MLIECPSCGARAELADQADTTTERRVRCASCRTVFNALEARVRPTVRASRPAPARGGSKGLIYGAVGVVALVVVVILVRSGKDAPAPVVTATETTAPEPEVDEGIGWDSYPVQALVALYDDVAAGQKAQVKRRLYGPGLFAIEREGQDVEGPLPTAFAAEPPAEREAILDRGVELVTASEHVAGWKPYDCEVISRSEDEARVRLAVSPRDAGGIEKRWVSWDLVRDGDAWKAWRFERWISAAEERTARLRDRNKRVYLSDGSSVFERPPEPLPHLDDTPTALRDEINLLYATMTDLDLTREASAAQHRLVEIGRPAIPILLTGLFETPLDTEENAIKCNLVVQTLRRITGQYFGYEPQVAEASSVGTTDERRQSSIRQWFAWWYTNQDTFTEKVVEDALEKELGMGDSGGI